MKTLSLILAILGLLSLLLILIYQKPLSINSPEQLTNIIPNQLIQTQGYVIEEKYTKTNKILVLNNNLEIICDKSCPTYLYRNISVLGVYDDFYKKIKALKIKTIS